MKTLHTLLATAGLLGAGLGVAALSAPVETAAFNPLGGSLGQGQRDFRVDNNFTDATANNNVTAQTMFPGQLGAVLAVDVGGNGRDTRGDLAYLLLVGVVDAVDRRGIHHVLALSASIIARKRSNRYMLSSGPGDASE